MDWSWLGNLFGDLVNVLKPLTKIAHWRIWAAIWDLIQRFRNWYKWYQNHVQKRMQAIRAMYQHYFNKWVLPVLKIVDLIRRITGVVSIIDKKLAQKLNTVFLRVESYILLPLNTVMEHINKLQRVFSGFLTPLGYLDRLTLLNSLWRDAGLLRELLRNPFGGSVPGAPAPDPVKFDDQFLTIENNLQGKDSPINDAVNASLATIRTYLRLSE